VLADEPTGALDSKNSKVLMDKLSAINKEQKKTIVMVTHNANAASYCSRILFIQDGRLFHELRKNIETENSDSFYERIVTVMAQLGGGSANVL
jgi:putative ABC transport system ATP-binding protein